MLFVCTVLFRVDLHFVVSLFMVLVGRVVVILMDFIPNCPVGRCLQIFVPITFTTLHSYVASYSEQLSNCLSSHFTGSYDKLHNSCASSIC